ncbi:MAG: HAMP domain-containing protein [Candidatus Rokubacteria bacterium]|nr:HAMP domain-containing protein [Candidatus Rokubacteria bacterium]
MTAFHPRLRFVSLQTRFLWGTVLLIALVMAALMVIVEHRQRVAIIDEVQERGAVLARNLAAISTGPLLLYNFTALEQNVTQVAEETDVVYAIVLDLEGKVAAHSKHPERVGAAMTDPASARAAGAEAPLIQETVLAEHRESLYDFAVPIQVERQRWGTVRVGLSKRRMEAEIAKTRRELALLAVLTLVVGGLASALVARRIARPVRRLADGVAAVSRGELNQRIEASTSDEIGHLALAFNHMASQLLQQRTQLEVAHAELRQRFAELSDLKSYTDNILGSLTSGIITLDREGRVVTLNAAAEVLTGCSLAEVRGRFCTEAFAHAPEVGELLMGTVASRVGVTLVSATLRRRDTTSIPVEITTAPLKGGDGKDLGVVAVLRDLTAVRQLEEQLRRSERLAGLGTLAAGLAHEIKNPLTSLLIYSQQLSRRFGDERFRQNFETVVPRELERINNIVESLLQLARPTRLSLRPVQLPDLLERALELYANQIEAKQITVVREYVHALPPIQADQEHLYRALVNLVVNALDAMGKGGRLTLRAGLGDGVDPFLAPRRWAFTRQLKVEVEDTGPGISSSKTGEIFNPFFTTKPGGTGLGLAMTHKIIEAHGGTITFRSVPGTGTTFTVLLPLTAEPQAERRGNGA